MKKNIAFLLLFTTIILSACIKVKPEDTANTSGFNCATGNCISVSDNAQYTTLSACQASCTSGGSGAGYNCVSGNCASVSSGAQYSTLSACQSSCSTSPPATGQLMIWTNAPTNGFPCGFNSLNVDIYGVVLNGNTIYGGYYTTAPSCGATYCYTKNLAPGNYTVRGYNYAFGTTCAAYYTNPKTVTVYSNQCTKVVVP